MKRICIFITMVLSAALFVGCGPVDKTVASSDPNAPSNKRLREERHYDSIYDMLAIQSGVTVEGSTVRVGPAGTINGNLDPLFIVDGIVCNDISAIPPDDIYDIEILKGPDTAIYGILGGAGVIKLTTKAAHAVKVAEKEARAAERAARKAR